MTYAGIGLDSRALSELDHQALVLADAVREVLGDRGLIDDLVGGDLVVATHWVPSAAGSAAAGSGAAGSVAALSVGLPGLEETAAWQALHAALAAVDVDVQALVVGELGTGGTDRQFPARAAADLHARHRGGRLVAFAGSSTLGEEVTVGYLLASTRISRVRVLAGAAAEDDAVVLTRRHVRPVWSAGELELTVQPAAAARFVPFESPTPTPCCAVH